MNAIADVTSYTELIVAIRARIGDLGIRYEDFDVLAGFAPGLSGKVFGPSQVKRLGPEKLFDAMRAASLKLRTEPDAEQLAKMQKQMTENCQPRQANQARMSNNASPVGTALMSRVFKHLSRLGNDARKRKLTKEQRSKSAQHAANSRWKNERKRRRAAHRRRQRDKLRADPEVVT